MPGRSDAAVRGVVGRCRIWGATRSATALPSSTPVALPDGSGQIVFGRFEPSFEDFVSYTVDPNGNGEGELLPGPHQLSRWSPDGTLITITAVSGSRVFAATIRPDGTGYTELPIDDPTLNVGCMLWSPDGTRLACEGWDDTDPTRNGIYTINASDGGDLQRVTSSPAAITICQEAMLRTVGCSSPALLLTGTMAS